MTPTDNISREQKIIDILIPAFGATTMLTIMEGRCTDGVIKIRDDAIDAIIALPDNSSQIREMVGRRIKEHDDYIEGNISIHCIKAFGGKHALQELLDEIDNLPNQSQWIPVSTPPTESGGYIVCEEYLEGKQHIGVEYYYHLSDVWSRPNSITEWMPLPLPPTK